MEVLVQWFTDNLSQHISRELIIFIISMIPILELRGGLLAASLLKVSEHQYYQSTVDLHYRKYYSYTIYITVYSSDF